MIQEYFIHLTTIICIYLILAISLQVAFGYGGLLNLGQVAFFGIGAYISALLLKHGLPFAISLIVVVFVTVILGYLLSMLTKKLSGDYFALATLGFSFVIYSILLNWKDVTGGPQGMPDIPRPDIFGLVLSNNLQYSIFVIVTTIICYLFIHRVCNSPFGKLIEATRDNELAAKSLGKNTEKIKTIAFIISTCFAGVAGSLFASYLQYLDPSSFSFATFIPILLIVIIGGLRSLPGTIFATLVITLLPEPLRFIGLPSSMLGPLRQLIYAFVLLLILYYMPRGFYGKVDLE